MHVVRVINTMFVIDRQRETLNPKPFMCEADMCGGLGLDRSLRLRADRCLGLDRSPKLDRGLKLKASIGGFGLDRGLRLRT